MGLTWARASLPVGCQDGWTARGASAAMAAGLGTGQFNDGCFLFAARNRPPGHNGAWCCWRAVSFCRRPWATAAALLGAWSGSAGGWKGPGQAESKPIRGCSAATGLQAQRCRILAPRLAARAVRSPVITEAKRSQAACSGAGCCWLVASAPSEVGQLGEVGWPMAAPHRTTVGLRVRACSLPGRRPQFNDQLCRRQSRLLEGRCGSARTPQALQELPECWFDPAARDAWQDRQRRMGGLAAVERLAAVLEEGAAGSETCREGPGRRLAMMGVDTRPWRFLMPAPSDRAYATITGNLGLPAWHSSMASAPGRVASGPQAEISRHRPRVAMASRMVEEFRGSAGARWHCSIPMLIDDLNEPHTSDETEGLGLEMVGDSCSVLEGTETETGGTIEFQRHRDGRRSTARKLQRSPASQLSPEAPQAREQGRRRRWRHGQAGSSRASRTGPSLALGLLVELTPQS